MNTRRSDQKGFALLHLLLPLTVVVLVGIVGIRVLALSHADTVSSALADGSAQPVLLDSTAMTNARSDALVSMQAQNVTSCSMFPSTSMCLAGHTTDSADTTTVTATPSGADATSLPCTSSGCGPLSYHNGPVQHNPKILFLEWGPKWKTETLFKNIVSHFVTGLGVENVTAPDKWSSTLNQYYDSTGAPWSYVGNTTGPYIDTSTPPTGVTGSQIAAEAAAFVKQQGIAPANYLNTIVIVATQQGVCPAGSDTCGNGGYCAYHSWNNVAISGGVYTLPFVNLPYYNDEPACANGQPVPQEYTAAAGHETAETITDPEGNAWYNDKGGEIADECPGIKKLTWHNGAVGMQSLYSNAGKGCVYSSGVQGEIVSKSNNACLDDYGSSVASGNKIDTWSCNQGRAQILTHYPDKTLRVQGRCVSDPAGGGVGTNVTLQICDASPQQQWSYNTTSGAYSEAFNGLCMRNPDSGSTYGGQLGVYTCSGATYQGWTTPH